MKKTTIALAVAAALWPASAHGHVPNTCKGDMVALLAAMLAKTEHQKTAPTMSKKMVAAMPNATRQEALDMLAELAAWTSKLQTLDNAVSPKIGTLVRCAAE